MSSHYNIDVVRNLSNGTLESSSLNTRHTQRNVHYHANTTGKPPNIFIFSESFVSSERIKSTLCSVLHRHRYTIYSLKLSQILSSTWVNQAKLVIVYGKVPDSVAQILLQYVLQQNGSLLCLCSNLFKLFLPFLYVTEVQQQQLVPTSYSNWKNVWMMHDTFCYQSINLNFPKSVDVLDRDYRLHTLCVDVLAVEEVHQTPTVIMARNAIYEGQVVFSQIHLETDPSQYEGDSNKFNILMDSNASRLEILSHLLSTYFHLECQLEMEDHPYTIAYFLGSNELKHKFLGSIKNRLESNCGAYALQMQQIMLSFCGKGVLPPSASATLLPILMYSYPETFNCDSYFNNLETQELGRLVIFSEVMTTSMAVLAGPPLAHGLAVIPCHQTSGKGRGGNVWLSPEGCAMFSLQLHVPLHSKQGQILSFLQHTVATAVVSSIRSLPKLEGLELGLKWPNDIYAGSVKVGGVIVSSILMNGFVICNVGCGLNLDNNYPTVCVNDLISQLNSDSGLMLPLLSKEKYFAIVFTQLEKLLLMIESGQQNKVLELYYKYWMHGGAKVNITDLDGNERHVTVVGVDEYGFLRVHADDWSEVTVHPDGNTFDMLAGLIAPKLS